MEQIIKIVDFIFNSFIHIWPYLIISIPLAVFVQVTGAAKFINKALNKKPLISILLATIVGAFSPFCSCGVIPIITTLLLGGVPIAPVMSFWIASPSMDPEIFFLSVATIGWKMSIWRLASTFLISLSSGYITHFAILKGFLGKEVLRNEETSMIKLPWKQLRLLIINGLKKVLIFGKLSANVSVQLISVNNLKQSQNMDCCVTVEETIVRQTSIKDEEDCNCDESTKPKAISFRRKLAIETWKASILVVKFMALAFFINALISFYVPQETISGLLGGAGSFSVIIATLVGIPAYTSNLTALPLISGLISLGMNQGAALAFLIAGPTTTLPAMIAVWGITKRKVFLLYISFSLIGAIIFGILYNFIN